MKVFIYPILLSFFCLSPAISAADGLLTSSDLPIVVIDTNGQTISDEPKIEAQMGIIDNGQGIRNYLTDPFNGYNGKIGIEVRGGSSQNFPKKQYAVETRDDAGNDVDVSLLDMPAESDWILSAPYTDKTLIRNMLVYKLSNDMGHYASRTRFCEVVINGDYQGVYVLMEKIKRGKNRVNISSLKSDAISGDNLSGGYIIKIDKLKGQDTLGWYSAYSNFGREIYYQYHYPKQEDIVSEQKDYIQDYIERFEMLMAGDTYKDGYPAIINTGSFADFLILNELSRNVDGYRLSTFMFKDKDSKGGKLTMGPVWDFDLGFGNADYYDGYLTSGWQADFSYSDDNQIPFWWKRLRDDPAFQNIVRARWQALREDILKSDRINSLIDEMSGITVESRVRNFTRWPILGKYVWPNKFIGKTYADEISYLKTWIAQRFLWLDSQWISCAAGDINGDSRTDLSDAISALRICIGADVASPTFICKKASVSADGKIGIADVIYILQKVSGLR
ncbi:MAG: spore coat protein CotH [Desulfobacteraceae bacterium]|nr:spore coat protein CotH [Desulfobacteraceae bacterium]